MEWTHPPPHLLAPPCYFVVSDEHGHAVAYVGYFKDRVVCSVGGILGSVGVSIESECGFLGVMIRGEIRTDG